METLNSKKKYILIIGLVILVFLIGRNILTKDDNEDIIFEDFQGEVEQVEIGEIYCDIKGEVVNPGVYKMNVGDRIIDLVYAAGGLKETADTSYINLSARVSDEMVVIISRVDKKSDTSLKENEKKTFFVGAGTIPKPIVKNVITKNETTTETKVESNDDSENNEVNNEVNNDGSTNDSSNNSDNSTNNSTDSTNTDSTNKDSATTGNSNNSNSKININTASQSLLESLPGIGPSKASAIINYRNDNGSFKSIDEITNVSGIGNSTFDKIKNLITV